MAVSDWLLSTNITPIKTSQINSKLSQHQGKTAKASQMQTLLPAVIAYPISDWKLMRNCLRASGTAYE